MSRRTTAIGIAALSLAVVWLGVANWDDDEKGERIRVTEEPKGSLVAPPGYSLDAPAQPAPRWDPNAARNSKDLHAAFVQARDSSNPVAWYVAAEICGECFARHINRTFINKYIGEYNSIRAGDPNRAAELAALKRRQVALAELEIGAAKGSTSVDMTVTRPSQPTQSLLTKLSEAIPRSEESCAHWVKTGRQTK